MLSKSIFSGFFCLLVIIMVSNINEIKSQDNKNITSPPPSVEPSYDQDINEDTKVELSNLFETYKKHLYQTCDGINERMKLYATDYFTSFDQLKNHALKSSPERLKSLSLGEIELILKMRSKLTTNELETLAFREIVIRLNCYEIPYPLTYDGKLTKLRMANKNRISGSAEGYYIKSDVFFIFEEGQWKINPFGGTPYGMIYDMEKLKTTSKDIYIKEYLKKEGLDERILMPLK